MMRQFLLTIYIMLNILHKLCDCQNTCSSEQIFSEADNNCEAICPVDWHYRSNFNGCVKLIDANSWAQARITCKAGGTTPDAMESIDLIAILDQTINDDLINEDFTQATELYWIGLHGDATEGTYEWSTAPSQPLTYTGWAVGLLNTENTSRICGAYQNKEWFTQDCGELLQGICSLPDANKCLTLNGGCQGVCKPRFMDRICDCPEGQTEQADGSCQASDPCLLDNGGCEHNCSLNDAGQRICTCRSGFLQSPTQDTACTDIDECVQAKLCEHICTNVPGSYKCSCNAGYTQTEDRCILSNPCTQNNGGCLHNCLNIVPGFRRCKCKSGYVQRTDALCEDINECEEGNGGCAQSCSNTGGSYVCSCSGNLVSQGYGCVASNPCQIENGGCEQTCKNTGPGYRNCSCGRGFIEDGNNCIDIDECDIHNGGCSHRCNNKPGTFACSCIVSFHLVGSTQCIENGANILIIGCTFIAVMIAGGFAFIAKMQSKKVKKNRPKGRNRKEAFNKTKKGEEDPSTENAADAEKTEKEEEKTDKPTEDATAAQKKQSLSSKGGRKKSAAAKDDKSETDSPREDDLEEDEDEEEEDDDGDEEEDEDEEEDD